MKSIQSPDGVALLMENLWLRHKAGIKQRPCNVFMVDCLHRQKKSWRKLVERHWRMTVRMMTPRNYMAHGFNRP